MSDTTMRVLIVEPQKPPRAADIPNTLEAMQSLVGGTIQALYPFDDPVALICNDEGNVQGLPLNRMLRDTASGEVYDIISGTFFLCAAPGDSDSFESLSGEQVRKYSGQFARLEYFLNTGQGLMILVM